ncbi:hypothetical protein DL766_004821 [Monosporascus sp. MC13-8B]|uniref:Transcription factor domain-containing protein n=1 Tax=Monosporascus cannonballus TaxID=155416 RepID=A0ABY0HI71_9PEZI|nr:hypothetical protein DL762_001258 [Monosporascus cannonballus]RYO99691.1 hypothetical protein DL763_001299 [Monosporascus cannonballus]RYP30549.1 hypothetical protein DL766_004821 [Monosporascus sp. MC13-8B]
MALGQQLPLPPIRQEGLSHIVPVQMPATSSHVLTSPPSGGPPSAFMSQSPIGGDLTPSQQHKEYMKAKRRVPASQRKRTQRVYGSVENLDKRYRSLEALVSGLFPALAKASAEDLVEFGRSKGITMPDFNDTSEQTRPSSAGPSGTTITSPSSTSSDHMPYTGLGVVSLEGSYPILPPAYATKTAPMVPQLLPRPPHEGVIDPEDGCLGLIQDSCGRSHYIGPSGSLAFFAIGWRGQGHYRGTAEILTEKLAQSLGGNVEQSGPNNINSSKQTRILSSSDEPSITGIEGDAGHFADPNYRRHHRPASMIDLPNREEADAAIDCREMDVGIPEDDFLEGNILPPRYLEHAAPLCLPRYMMPASAEDGVHGDEKVWRRVHLLHVRYHHTLCLLARPFLLKIIESVNGGSTLGPDAAIIVGLGRICLTGAMRAADLLLEMWRANCLNGVTWTDVFYAHQASLTIILAWLSPQALEQDRDQDPSQLPFACMQHMQSYTADQMRETVRQLCHMMTSVDMCGTHARRAKVSLELAKAVGIIEPENPAFRSSPLPNARHIDDKQGTGTEDRYPTGEDVKGGSPEFKQSYAQQQQQQHRQQHQEQHPQYFPEAGALGYPAWSGDGAGAPDMHSQNPSLDLDFSGALSADPVLASNEMQWDMVVTAGQWNDNGLNMDMIWDTHYPNIYPPGY